LFRLMQIGEAASRVGLSLRTIRHWDEVGLVVPSERSAGGFRLYTEADVERLALIKTLKPLDFSLEQVRELLATVDAVDSDPGDDAEHTAQLQGRLAMFRAAADGRIEALRAQVHGLETLSRELRSLAASSKRRTGEHARSLADRGAGESSAAPSEHQQPPGRGGRLRESG
jgi:DNA-binding transcriptional MerR regulator